MLTEQLKSHFLNMYLIAMSDSNFAEKEMEAIIRIGEEKGISKDEFEKIIMNPHLVSYNIPQDTVKKIEYLFDYARIIWADKEIEDEEKKSLYDFCQKFGFEREISKELTDWLLELVKKEISSEQLHIEIENLLKS